MRHILTIAFLTFIGIGGVTAQNKCFENNGLKDAHSIEMSINGKSVTGSFGIAIEYDEDRVKRYDFAGTIAGSVISVKFPDGTPVELPSSPSTKRWTLIRSASGEKLRVTLYGKNYNSNRWGNYTVDYTSCKDPYDEAASSAKRITFAKGTNSLTADVSFARRGEKKSYKLGFRAGQSVSVSAPGCGISFFYPDKTPYEEGTAIDTWGSDKLPQSGDYLFVISPAGQPSVCKLRFEAK